MIKYRITGNAVQLCIIDENLTNLDSEEINEMQIPISFHDINTLSTGGSYEHNY